MFERFDESARRALFFARYDATQLHQLTIEPEHIASGAVRAIAQDRHAEAIARLQAARTGGVANPVSTSMEIPFSASAKRILESAAAIADEWRHRSITPAHLLAAVLSQHESTAAIVLREMGFEASALLNAVSDQSPGTASRPSYLHSSWDEHQIRGVVDDLFIETDEKDWQAVRSLFVDDTISVDMTSLAGGAPLNLTADDLVAGFRAGLHEGKTSHHMVTNYKIVVDAPHSHAVVWAHGYAWNRVVAWPAGEDLWETWGTYEIGLRRVSGVWRIDAFRYNSKLTRGNDLVRTQTA